MKFANYFFVSFFLLSILLESSYAVDDKDINAKEIFVSFLFNFVQDKVYAYAGKYHPREAYEITNTIMKEKTPAEVFILLIFNQLTKILENKHEMNELLTKVVTGMGITIVDPYEEVVPIGSLYVSGSQESFKYER